MLMIYVLLFSLLQLLNITYPSEKHKHIENVKHKYRKPQDVASIKGRGRQVACELAHIG